MARSHTEIRRCFHRAGTAYPNAGLMGPCVASWHPPAHRTIMNSGRVHRTGDTSRRIQYHLALLFFAPVDIYIAVKPESLQMPRRPGFTLSKIRSLADSRHSKDQFMPSFF